MRVVAFKMTRYLGTVGAGHAGVRLLVCAWACCVAKPSHINAMRQPRDLWLRKAKAKKGLKVMAKAFRQVRWLEPPIAMAQAALQWMAARWRWWQWSRRLGLGRIWCWWRARAFVREIRLPSVCGQPLLPRDFCKRAPAAVQFTPTGDAIIIGVGAWEGFRVRNFWWPQGCYSKTVAFNIVFLCTRMVSCQDPGSKSLNSYNLISCVWWTVIFTKRWQHFFTSMSTLVRQKNEWQKICQIEGQKGMPDRIPERYAI